MVQERLAKVALILGGGTVFLIGVRSLVAPQAAVEPLGIVLSGPSAMNEIRASFGGMHAGVGSFLLASAFLASTRRAALVLLLLYMSGFVVGRLASALFDGAPSTLIWGLLSVEVVFAALAAAALWAQPRPTKPS